MKELHEDDRSEGVPTSTVNQPSLVFSWNKDNNNFVWLKMGKWVTKCSVNI